MGHRLLIINFKNQLKENQVPLFRGAIINTMKEKHLLLHNHQKEGFRYSYPLIQYKSIAQKASIVCIDEGIDVIESIVPFYKQRLTLSKRTETWEIENIEPALFSVQIYPEIFTYQLKGWLPLNQESYKRYQQTTGLSDQIKLLDQILIGNILSFSKGIKVFFEQQIICCITQLRDSYIYAYKGVKMQCFDIEFECNVSLPCFIGLGKGSSIGRGIVFPIK